MEKRKTKTEEKIWKLRRSRRRRMKIVVVIITIIIMTKEQEREGGEDHFHWSEVDHRYARRKSWTNSPFSHSKNFRCNVTHQKSSSLQDKALGHSSTEPLSYESPLLPT
jgi:hypothetical protein